MGNKSLINSPAISQEVNNVMVSAGAWGSFFCWHRKAEAASGDSNWTQRIPDIWAGRLFSCFVSTFWCEPDWECEMLHGTYVCVCVCMCALTGAVRHFFSLVLSQYRAIIDSLEAFNPFVLVWDALSRRDDEKFQNLHENCMNTFFGGICLQVMGLI